MNCEEKTDLLFISGVIVNSTRDVVSSSYIHHHFNASVLKRLTYKSFPLLPLWSQGPPRSQNITQIQYDSSVTTLTNTQYYHY